MLYLADFKQTKKKRDVLGTVNTIGTGSSFGLATLGLNKKVYRSKWHRKLTRRLYPASGVLNVITVGRNLRKNKDL